MDSIEQDEQDKVARLRAEVYSGSVPAAWELARLAVRHQEAAWLVEATWVLEAQARAPAVGKWAYAITNTTLEPVSVHGRVLAPLQTLHISSEQFPAWRWETESRGPNHEALFLSAVTRLVAQGQLLLSVCPAT